MPDPMARFYHLDGLDDEVDALIAEAASGLASGRFAGPTEAATWMALETFRWAYVLDALPPLPDSGLAMGARLARAEHEAELYAAAPPPPEAAMRAMVATWEEVISHWDKRYGVIDAARRRATVAAGEVRPSRQKGTRSP